MRSKLTIKQRGVITVPSRFRKSFDLKAGDELLLETTAEGLLLRPAVTLPIEIYSEDRIAEFSQDDDEISRRLDS